jgi:hypothetical protein
MNGLKRASLLLGLLGLASIVAAILMLQFAPVAAQGEAPLVPLPNDYRYWFHIGSKSIRPEGAEAVGLPAAIFGNTFDAVYANTVALNDLRSGTRPFRDGAVFVAPFYALTSPVAGLDAPGDLAFTAVMVKDSQAFASTGGWGFEAFGPDGSRLTDLRQACVDCHTAQASGNDLVFSTLEERAVRAVPASDNGVFLPPEYREMFHVGSKVIRPEAAEALGLPVDIFGNTFDAVYANPTALGALQTGERPFPVGSLFVADFHALATPVQGLDAFGAEAFTAVMIKTSGAGDDPSTGDWAFEAFGADGTALSDLRGACVSCHASQAGNDFVFTNAAPADGIAAAPSGAGAAPAATEEAGAATGGACTVTPAAGDVNIRSGPGTDFTEQGTLAAGSTASVDGQFTAADGQLWYHLVAEVNSWVRADVVNTSGDCSAVPVLQP